MLREGTIESQDTTLTNNLRIGLLSSQTDGVSDSDSDVEMTTDSDVEIIEEIRSATQMIVHHPS